MSKATTSIEHKLELITKIKKSSRLYSVEQITELKEPIFTKEELQEAIELGTLLYDIKFFLNDIDEKYFIIALDNAKVNFNSIPENKKTPKLQKHYLKKVYN